jgi:hypothetical protein
MKSFQCIEDQACHSLAMSFIVIPFVKNCRHRVYRVVHLI